MLMHMGGICKRGTDYIIYKTERDTDIEGEKYGYQGGMMGTGGMNWETGVDIYTLLILFIK